MTPLEGQKPILREQLERRLLLARDVPGTKLVSTLEALPGATKPGELLLSVNVVHDQFDAFATANNLAGDEAGPYIGTAGLAGNSIIFAGDRLQLVGLSTHQPGEQLLGQVSYSLPTGVEGLSASISFTNSISEPGDALELFDIDYRAHIGRASLDYALIRQRGRTLSLGLGFEAVHQTQNADFTQFSIDEDLRVLDFGMRLVERDFLLGQLDASANLRIGLPGLGASQDGDSGVTGDPQFVSGIADARYTVLLRNDLALRTRILGQVSTGDLPSYEVLSLGNYTLGRGFEPGAASGDRGVAGSFELTYDTDLTLPPWVSRQQIYAFADLGIVFAEDNDAGIASVGLGTRWTLFDQFDADLFFAVPIASSELVDEDGVQAYFRTTARF